jgi:hypothetical protein
MVPLWARPMLGRVAMLTTLLAFVLGATWLIAGSARNRRAEPVPPQPSAAKKAKQPGNTTPAPSDKPIISPEPPAEFKPADFSAVNPNESPKKEANPMPEAKVPNLIEVDLSKLPPDLARQVQGAIVDKPAPKGNRNGGDR